MYGLTVEDYVDAMLKVQDGVKPEVMANISKAQEYQKQYYNQQHTTQACCVYVLMSCEYVPSMDMCIL